MSDSAAILVSSGGVEGRSWNRWLMRRIDSTRGLPAWQIPGNGDSTHSWRSCLALDFLGHVLRNYELLGVYRPYGI
jgi:hypothetical protein